MRIGILTFHTPCNFGANLQAYSTVQYFTKQGHDVVVLNFIRKKDDGYKQTVSDKQWDAHHQFVKTRLPLTKELHSENEVRDEIKAQNLDLILIGADAVWRAPQNKDDLIYYGTWLKDADTCDIQTASLSAAHMGNGYADISGDAKNIIQECLSRFKVISVRDSWTRDRLNKDIFGTGKVDIVNPDPVVWLSDFLKNRQLSLPEGIKKKQYIAMTLPKDWIKVHTDEHLKWFKSFKDIVNGKGLKLVELPVPEGVSGADFDYTVQYPLDPADWFVWIRDAYAFCGIRFHAIVSSISAGTPFFSVDSYGNPSRLIAIAKRLGFYRIARAFDYRSKIRNLLKGTGFEDLRVHGEIASISPAKIVDKLSKVELEKILKLRDSLRRQFDTTADTILK